MAHLNRNTSSNQSHPRRENPPSGPDQYRREHSQNEVKIEEYESDQVSDKGLRSPTIRFVMLKDDAFFENPNTPELKAVLKRRVVKRVTSIRTKNSI